jgi:hypothetical protein
MSWQRRSLLLLWCFAAGAVCAASAEEPPMDAMRATFKIANENSTATCFVIARPGASETSRRELVLVTAAHVFETMSGDECRIVLHEERADGTFVRNEVPLKIRSAEKPLWLRHSEVDVAALKLELPAGRTIAALDIDRLAGESAVGNGKLRSADEVWILCYPAQLESSSAGFPVLRRGTVASFPLTPIESNRTFLVDFTTFGGDSGAPVVVRDRNASDAAGQRTSVVGLVSGMHRETTKSISPVEERTVHRPLGLAIVVHAEFIRQTIDRVPH